MLCRLFRRVNPYFGSSRERSCRDLEDLLRSSKDDNTSYAFSDVLQSTLSSKPGKQPSGHPSKAHQVINTNTHDDHFWEEILRATMRLEMRVWSPRVLKPEETPCTCDNTIYNPEEYVMTWIVSCSSLSSSEWTRCCR